MRRPKCRLKGQLLVFEKCGWVCDTQTLSWEIKEEVEEKIEIVNSTYIVRRGQH
jgi:hypothetical protein